MGAGVGYWAFMLRNAGVDVKAYDKQPPTSTIGKKAVTHPSNTKKVSTNEYHGRFDAWSEVSYGDATSASNTSRVLFLCYPPPKDPMALRTLRCFTGDRMAHVGEMKGDTGTEEFETELATMWVRHGDPIILPNFGDTCYALTLWIRREKEKEKGRTSNSTSPSTSYQYLGLMTCPGCGTVPQRQNDRTMISWYRDRLTRSVWACSIQCVYSTEARCALSREMLLRSITYGMSDTPIKDDHLWHREVLQIFNS